MLDARPVASAVITDNRAITDHCLIYRNVATTRANANPRNYLGTITHDLYQWLSDALTSLGNQTDERLQGQGFNIVAPNRFISKTPHGIKTPGSPELNESYLTFHSGRPFLIIKENRVQSKPQQI